MADYLIAMLIVALVFSGWLCVQHIARRFAQHHPEFREPREQTGGCCGSCGGCLRPKTGEQQ